MKTRGVDSVKRAVWTLVGLSAAVACSTTAGDLGGNVQPGESDGGGSGGSGGSGYGTGGSGAAGKGGGGKGSGGTVTAGPNGKLDLLIVLDNSISAAAQQKNLTLAIPDFVKRVVSETAGATDVHVGLVTTSLGGHGSDACPTNRPGEEGEAVNDNGMLIGSRPRFQAAAQQHPTALPTTAEGFVEWTSSDSTAALGETVAAMVEASGSKGCGYESPLEAMYRFLSDPLPPLELELFPCSANNPSQCVRKRGVNDALLAQRGAFLRPDSAVAVGLFTDEDDCSIIERDQGFYAAQEHIQMSRATSICATNPNDACCVSCLATPPTGCAPDRSAIRQRCHQTRIRSIYAASIRSAASVSTSSIRSNATPMP